MTETGAKFQKRSVSLAGHRTSVALEAAFWAEIDAAAARRGLAIAALIAEVDRDRSPGQNLASALRLFVLHEVKRG